MATSRSTEAVIHDPHSGTLSPLDNGLHQGLLVMSVVGLFSMIVTSVLFFYLTWRMCAWRLNRGIIAKRIANNMPAPPIGAEFTAEEREYGQSGQDARTTHETNLETINRLGKSNPNQFLILVHNLLLADMLQAAAILLSGVWVANDGIQVQTSTCFAQGFLAVAGDLSSSCFITLIAIHTYLSVVRGYRPPQWVIYVCCVAIWTFALSFTGVPIAVTQNGRDEGGYFLRVGAWCWVNDEYLTLRVLTHYVFIFISFAVTTVLYLLIYLRLRRQAYQITDEVRTKYNPAFLIYPIIYLACTLPLAVARILTMNGADVPMGFWCFAGAAIASNGWCDCLVFGTTRHTIMFGSLDEVGAEDTGLGTFAFMRTPAGKQFGNVVWIEGGEVPEYMLKDDGMRMGGWWRRRSHKPTDVLDSFTSNASSKKERRRRDGYRDVDWRRTRSLSQQSLRSIGQKDQGIQMDVVTTMTVEMDGRGNKMTKGSISTLDTEYRKPC